MVCAEHFVAHAMTQYVFDPDPPSSALTGTVVDTSSTLAVAEETMVVKESICDWGRERVKVVRI